MSKTTQQSYYEKNREELCRKKREHYQKNRKIVLRRVKKYQEKNKEEILDKKREYYKKNTIRILGMVKGYRKTYSCKVAERKYRQSPKGLFADREKHHRRRIVGNKGKLTNQEWDEILRGHNFRCAYCGVKGNMTIDHVIPISKGGQHIAGNIVPACTECNSRKGARLGWKPQIFKKTSGENK